MADETGLICAYRFDGRGGGEALGWETLPDAADAANTWVHIHMDDERAQNWLRDESGIPAVAAEALLYDETRPRCTSIGDGLLLNLRGVNMNPGADPEDMVSIRLYLDKDRIISARRRKLATIADMRDRLDAGNGPRNSGDFLLDVTSHLLDRMGPIIADLDDAIDALTDTGRADMIRIQRLKKKKLALKDKIAKVENALLPDIIA